MRRNRCRGAGATAGACAIGLRASPYTLVYERTVGGNQDLYLAPAGGGVERRLTDDPATDGLPRWTRDGASVLFGSDRTGNWQLYSVGPRGGPARRLRENGWREWQLDGSPDGRSIAFLSNKEGPEYLLTMDLGSGAERVLARHGRNSILGNPTFSPDGRRIVFSSNWKVGHAVYLVNADGSGEQRVSPYRKGGCEPRFSPDGRKILYVSRGYLSKDVSRLVERDIESGQEKVLVDWPALNYNPVYSPDGSEVAFTSNINGRLGDLPPAHRRRPVLARHVRTRPGALARLPAAVTTRVPSVRARG